MKIFFYLISALAFASLSLAGTPPSHTVEELLPPAAEIEDLGDTTTTELAHGNLRSLQSPALTPPTPEKTCLRQLGQCQYDHDCCGSLLCIDKTCLIKKCGDVTMKCLYDHQCCGSLLCRNQRCVV